MPGKKVLIVDDEEITRVFVAGILADEGWETVEAEDGEEAVQYAALEVPDLVITDIMMPLKDGFETFYELRSNPKTEHIPIIVLTSVNDFELGAKHTAESMGEEYDVPAPEAFVEKPIDGDVLRAAVLEATS